jgi:hypothetical protein
MYTTVGALSGSCIYFMIFEFHKFQNNFYPISSRRITFSSTGLADSIKENIKYVINPGFFLGLFIGACRDYIDKDIIPAIIHFPTNESISPNQLIDKPST